MNDRGARMDRAEHARAARAGDGGNVAGHVRESRAREPCEAGGFDVVGIEAERRRACERRRRERVRERLASARDCARRRRTRRLRAHRARSRGSRRRSCRALSASKRRLHVCGRDAGAHARVEPVEIEMLAAGAFRRRRARNTDPRATRRAASRSTRPLAAHAPPSSRAVPRWRSAHASSRQFAGPVSKPSTSRPGASIVMFAMPPRLSTTRVAIGAANSAACSAGSSGAPWPPAATSARRKSAIVVMRVRSAITDGIADLQRERKRRRPGGAGSSGRASRSRRRRSDRHRRRAAAASAASANARADGDVERAEIVERDRGVRRSRASGMLARSASGYGVVRAAMTSRRGSKRTSAASMPSALVPEMRPR